MNKVGINRKCENCNLDFKLNSRVGLNWALKTGRGRFCSDKCSREGRRGVRVSIATEFTSEKIGWDKHPRFKTGIWSYQQFRGNSCEHCGSTKNLMVHHIDHNRNNNLKENFRTVCAKCHTTIEHPRVFGGNQYVKF